MNQFRKKIIRHNRGSLSGQPVLLVIDWQFTTNIDDNKKSPSQENRFRSTLNYFPDRKNFRNEKVVPAKMNFRSAPRLELINGESKNCRSLGKVGCKVR